MLLPPEPGRELERQEGAAGADGARNEELEGVKDGGMAMEAYLEAIAPGNGRIRSTPSASLLHARHGGDDADLCVRGTSSEHD